MIRAFRIAVLVALLHALDDAFVHRGPGLGLGQHALAGAVALAAAIAGIVAFPRLRPGAQSGLALSFGSLALANGLMHAAHPDAADLTGLAASGAGAVLVGIAVAIPWRRRGQATWKVRAVAVTTASLACFVVLGPMVLGVVATHKSRAPVGSPPSADYEDVTFKATDGLDLAGWYRPSRNGAAVLLVHGGSSDRKGSVAHAQMLARHGYGVLLYDARGRGDSDGSENNYGWDWPKDIAGALAFLKARPDVDRTRIGAVGLSTGADALIDAAAGRTDLAAVVADGAAAGSFEDWHHLRGTELGTAPGWVMFTTIHVLSGDPPGPPLEDQIRRITAPSLLISAGTDVEREFNVLYEAAARGPVEHWSLPEARHTRGIHDRPEEYERRVAAFFDAAFATRSARR